jgi:DNA-binding response OmpR family regulator
MVASAGRGPSPFVNNAQKVSQANAVNNGRTWLETARLFRPDLVILDLMLPKLDGVNNAQKVSQCNALKESHPEQS